MNKLYVSLAALLLAGCNATSRTSTIDPGVIGATRTAGPGDAVMDMQHSRPLPNAFGQPDVFGRRTNAGRTVVRFVGSQGKVAIFERSDVRVDSNATTMTETPLIVPHTSRSSMSGMVGNTPVSASESSISYGFIGPRPSTQVATASAPMRLSVGIGQSVPIEGRSLRVLDVSANAVTYRID